MKQARLKDISIITGLSINTISRALRDKSDINDETKRNIRKIADEIGYVPSLSAQALQSLKSRIIVLILPYESSEGSLHNTGYYSLIYGVSVYLQKNNYKLITFPLLEGSKEIDEFKMIVQSLNVEGVIFTRTKELDNRMLFLQKMNIPFASIGRATGINNYNWVDIDNGVFIKNSVSYFIGQGIRKICIIVTDLKLEFNREKIKTFKESLANNSISFKDDMIVQIDNNKLESISNLPYKGIILDSDKTFFQFKHQIKKEYRFALLSNIPDIVAITTDNMYLESQDFSLVGEKVAELLLKSMSEGMFFNHLLKSKSLMK